MGEMVLPYVNCLLLFWSVVRYFCQLLLVSNMDWLVVIIECWRYIDVSFVFQQRITNFLRVGVVDMDSWGMEILTLVVSQKGWHGFLQRRFVMLHVAWGTLWYSVAVSYFHLVGCELYSNLPLCICDCLCDFMIQQERAKLFMHLAHPKRAS